MKKAAGMETGEIVASTQEQAVASWIQYLNQVRLDKLAQALREIWADTAVSKRALQDDLGDALASINEAFQRLEALMGSNRGGPKGIHGFIAEIAQVGIGNARSQVLGGDKPYEWINDNGQWDFVRKNAQTGVSIPIQQKFQAHTVDHMSLQALLEHLKRYPDSLDVGGMYQIPKDHYEKMLWLKGMSEHEANRLPTSTGAFNRKEWEYVQQFFKAEDIPLERIEPADLTYQEVQAGKIHETIDTERRRLIQTHAELQRETDENAERQRKAAYEAGRPSLSEGVKVSLASAAMEGATAFVSAVVVKTRSGKRIRAFDEKDWMEIGGRSAIGVCKGGARGASIYALTNYTATPASVANALFTAAIGVAEQVHRFRQGAIDEAELLENSEILCLHTAVSALSSFCGQVLIPVPILGAVIGNVAGTLMYQFAERSFTRKEAELLREYLAELKELDKQLSEEYQSCISVLTEAFLRYLRMAEAAFSADIQEAFRGSVLLARSLGVPNEEILDTAQKRDAYFLC